VALILEETKFLPRRKPLRSFRTMPSNAKTRLRGYTRDQTTSKQLLICGGISQGLGSPQNSCRN
jgi:hypothetical protein